MTTREVKIKELRAEISELDRQIQDLTSRKEAVVYEEYLLRQSDDHHRQDGIPCTCPDGHFPPDRGYKLRALPHNYMGVLQHSAECERAKSHRAY